MKCNGDERYYNDERLDFGDDSFVPAVERADDYNDTVPDYDEDHADDSRWDYVAPEEPARRMSWLDDYRMNDPDQAPEKIRLLCQLISRYRGPRNIAFFEQAMLMSGYTDHADIVPFKCYYPVYADMSVSQMRSYFTIRTMLREGKTPDVPLSYLFVYIYELLMKVYPYTADECLQCLEEILEGYKLAQPKLILHLYPWIRDFVVYHQLTDALPRYFEDEREADKMAQVLGNYAAVSDGVLLDVMARLVSYSLSGSALYRKLPAEFTVVTARVIRGVIPVLEKRYHHHIATLFFGQKTKKQHPMFAGAVYYNPKPVKSLEVAISPRRKATCVNGLWTIDCFSGNVKGAQSNLFRAIFHETDRQLRMALKTGARLKTQPLDGELQNVIHNIILAWLRERQEAARPRINVDFSKLHRIREDADVVRQRLETGENLTEETTKEKVQEKITKPLTDNNILPFVAPKIHIETSPQSPFTDEERHFLRLVLDGADYEAYLRSIHVPAGVMTDAINEKMTDVLDDIAIEDDGTRLSIIDDYVKDIRDMI